MNDAGQDSGALRENELSTRVKDTIIQVLELDVGREQLTEDMSLYSSFLQMDSLTLLHLFVSLEQEFDIEIDDEDVMNAELKNVGSLVELVEASAARAGAADGGRTNGGGN